MKISSIRCLLIALLLLGGSYTANAATLTACASGCTYTTFSAALTAAADGDTIVLKAGETYTGAFTLPNKGVLTTGITITSDTMASLPPAGVRVTPAYAQYMPKIVSSGSGANSLSMANGANGYTLIGIDFPPTPLGFNVQFSIGVGSNEFEANEPYNVTVDRCYFHGDPVFGQKRAIEMNGKNATIINSYFEGIAAVGQDSQDIQGYNGHGPIDIENNYFEASTENIIFGGADPSNKTVMTVNCSPAPTTTTASVNVQFAGHTLAHLHVGDILGVQVGGGTARQHPHLVSVAGTGTTGTITFEPISVVPDCGTGDIRTGAITTGVTIRRNYFTKPLKWMNPILSTPTNITAAASTTAGTLAAGSYFYRIQALNANGYVGNTIYSTAAAEVTATLTATGQITLSWTAVPNATSYRVWGRATAAETTYWTVTTPTFTDTGTAGTAGTIAKGTKWQIKNLFELKTAANVQMDSNIFEYQWKGSDAGYAMWLKSVNQSGSCEFCQTRDVVIENNIFRHIDGVAEIVGQEYVPAAGQTVKNPVDAPPPMTNVTIRNNLVYDSSSTWAEGVTVYAFTIQNSPVNFTLDHNTIVHTMRGLFQMSGTRGTNMVVTNNMLRRETYGVLGTSNNTEGKSSLDAYTVAPPGYVFTKNAIAGISASLYPPGNFAPSAAAWEAAFVNYTPDGSSNANGPADYHLDPDAGIAYIGTATDGGNIGANIDVIFAATATAAGGGAVTVNPVSITTTGLADANTGVPYSAPIARAGGTAPFTWSISVGTLPAGLVIDTSTGLISGTPTTAGTSTFTVRVADAATPQQISTRPLTINVTAVTAPLVITNTSPLASAPTFTPYSVTLTATGGKIPYVWSVSSGTLPTGLTLNADTGVLSGTPTVTGTSTFDITVTGAAGLVATKTFSLTLTGETLSASRPVITVQNNLWPTITAPTLKFNYSEAQLFRRGVAPVVNDAIAVGDLWVDTSQSPPVLKSVASMTPTPTWSSVAVASSQHTLLSPEHSDTQPDTPQEGDLIVGGAQGDIANWHRVGIGTAGQVFSSDGTTAHWVTLPPSNVPDQLDVVARVNAPVMGVASYMVFAETNCTANVGVASVGFTRFCMDSVTHQMKVSTSGGSYQTIPSAGGGATGQMIIPLVTRGTSSTQWNVQPAALTEFNSSTGNRAPVDLTGYTQVRLYIKMFTAGFAGSTCRLEFSTDQTIWTALDGTSGPSLPIDASGSSVSSSWVTIASGNRLDGFIRIACLGGNATINPSFGNIVASFK